MEPPPAVTVTAVPFVKVGHAPFGAGGCVGSTPPLDPPDDEPDPLPEPDPLLEPDPPLEPDPLPELPPDPEPLPEPLEDPEDPLDDPELLELEPPASGAPLPFGVPLDPPQAVASATTTTHTTDDTGRVFMNASEPATVARAQTH